MRNFFKFASDTFIGDNVDTEKSAILMLKVSIVHAPFQSMSCQVNNSF